MVFNIEQTLTVCSYHVTYAFQSESTPYIVPYTHSIQTVKCTVQISTLKTAQPFGQFGSMVEGSFTT